MGEQQVKVNLFDLMVVIIAAGMCIFGLRDGFLRQAIKLCGFFITLVLLAVFSRPLTNVALSFEHLPLAVSIVLVFGSVFIILILLFHIAAAIVANLAALTPARFIDAGLGGAFGMLKGLIVCGFLAVILSGTPKLSFFQEQYANSQFARPLQGLVITAIPYLRSAADMVIQRLEPDREEEIEIKI